MKKKIFLFVLLGILVTSLAAASVLYVFQGLSDENRRWEYFEVYMDKAEEYIKTDPEMLSKYGEDFSVRFESSVTYSDGATLGFWERYVEALFPRVPKTLEEFISEIEWLMFKFEINGDSYEITLENNGDGELVVSNLTEAKYKN